MYEQKQIYGKIVSHYIKINERNEKQSEKSL